MIVFTPSCLWYRYNSRGFGMYCKKCEYKNKDEAKYCKKCGAALKESQGFIQKINQSINILSVLIGLFTSVLVLIGGSLLFGSLMATGNLDIRFYIVVVFYSMVIVGSLFTGILSGYTPWEGAINGGVMTLLMVINLGFLLGVIWFITVGVTAAIASAFSSIPMSTLPATPPTSTGIDMGSAVNIILDILAFLGLFAAGIIGGAAGSYIKNVVKL